MQNENNERKEETYRIEDIEDRRGAMEIDLEWNIKETQKEPGLSLFRLARVIKRGIGEDLPFLIKELKKLNKS
jgi:AraC-like DNA-binding protein